MSEKFTLNIPNTIWKIIFFKHRQSSIQRLHTHYRTLLASPRYSRHLALVSALVLNPSIMSLAGMGSIPLILTSATSRCPLGSGNKRVCWHLTTMLFVSGVRGHQSLRKMAKFGEIFSVTKS